MDNQISDTIKTTLWLDLNRIMRVVE